MKNEQLGFGLLGLAVLVTAAGCTPSVAAEPDPASSFVNEMPTQTEAVAQAEAESNAISDESLAPAGGAVELREGEHRKLGRLVGEWKGQGTLAMGGEKHGVTSSLACEVAPGGVAVRCTHDGQIEGMGQLYEESLFGFGPEAKTLHWYNVNTMGETHDHTGHWTKEGIEWTYQTIAEGAPMVEAISMKFDPSGAMTFRSETKVGGKRVALFEGSLKKGG